MKYIAVILLLTLLNCKTSKVPNRSDFQQAKVNLKFEIQDSNILFNLQNPLQAPLRVTINSNNSELNNRFGTVILQPLQDSIFTIQNASLSNFNLKFRWNFGDPNKKIIKEKLRLPFSKNKPYKVIQGYNGTFSHDNDYSRYAIDFNLKENDTVKSADNGFVVGVVNHSSYYGNDIKFRDFANYVTIYNIDTGIYTQYVHLKKNKVFVKVGDKIKRGQSIALSGLSGFMSGEHLHFNVLIPDENGLKSTSINFENYEGSDLIKDQSVVY